MFRGLEAAGESWPNRARLLVRLDDKLQFYPD
jgi:hypothetical protein